MTDHARSAGALFMRGYNCAQAVFCAFQDVMQLDDGLALKLTSGMGGGVSRLREICGAVSGAALVLGVLYGSDDPCDAPAKAEHYARVQAVAEKFRAENGSIVCRELLKLQEEKSEPVPAERTQAYYHSRPCCALVEKAARAVDEYIAEHPLKGV
ncbi:MAG: C_GCAxxG_C_C family protein [Clostridia bacterium]|nr:C_GCAxxG_C_C family protein [Clostridia bacterium]